MSLTKGGCAVLWSCFPPAGNVATALTLPFLRGNLTEWHHLVWLCHAASSCSAVSEILSSLAACSDLWEGLFLDHRGLHKKSVLWQVSLSQT